MAISQNRSIAQKARRAKQTQEELSALGKAMAHSRWSKMTKEQRSEYAKMMVTAREAKKQK